MDDRMLSRRPLLAAAAGTVATAVPRGRFSAMDAHIYGSLPGGYGVYNVMDYGAKGDAVTDDAPAITRTIAAVPSQGGIIYFPPGIYVLNSSIVVHARRDLSFVGAGVSATRLQVNANGVTALSFTGVC